MKENMDLSPKRKKLSNSQHQCALNLCVNPDSRYDLNSAAETSNESISNAEDSIQDDIVEMKKKFQLWVLETYRDASKTKTITAEKYSRIVKTLRGEIKNCAENSKFRFWMKCKGFKLESQGAEKTLYVLDKKGESVKYKKVAIVENFFDIIYNVHVNEGARGIQHAGQKRTHKSITETYAFLPREAVTKFLLCCVDCQKRITEDRKNSPLISSSSTHDFTSHTQTVDHNLILGEVSNYSFTEPGDKLFETYKPEQIEPTCQKINENNNIINKTDDFNVTSNLNQITYSKKQLNDDSANFQNTLELANENFTYNTEKLKIRKRKCRFTRKVIRSRSDVDDKGVNNKTDSSLEIFVRTPPKNHNINAMSVDQTVSSNDLLTPEIPFPFKQASELFSQSFSISDAEYPTIRHDSRFDAKKNTSDKTSEEKSNFNVSLKSCPYLSKISEIIYNPIGYAMSRKRKNFASSCVEEDFLEQLAVNLVLKAQEQDDTKSELSENEKQQISSKIYNFRITSFLLNYAADLLLKSLKYEI